MGVDFNSEKKVKNQKTFLTGNFPAYITNQEGRF